jgi:prepilin-type N-terminal cleavage/methylation domain-containing protein
MLNKGFTLVELVISIMIVAIVTTIAVPGVISYQNKQLEDQFVNQIINQLRSLENISLTKDINTKVFFDSGAINFCEVESTNCKELAVPSSLTDTVSLTNGSFYFDRYANLLDSDKSSLTVDSYSITTKSYKIIINKYGDISKEFIQN